MIHCISASALGASLGGLTVAAIRYATKRRARFIRMCGMIALRFPLPRTASFFNRIHHLAASLRARGGALSDSRIIVTNGANSVILPGVVVGEGA